MQLITAVIQKDRLDEVAAALATHGAGGITVTDVLGHGNQKGTTQVFRGREVRSTFLPKVRIDLIANDDAVENLVAVLVDAARTGEIGDGKVWTMPVSDVVRVRTGERGADAI